MAVDCHIHDIVFVLVTIPPRTVDVVELTVIDDDGHVVEQGVRTLTEAPAFLQAWLTRPCTHVKFICTLLSSYNACIFSRYMLECGYYDVAFNGLAYTRLTPELLESKGRDDAYSTAQFFGRHLVEDTRGWPQMNSRTKVYLACAHTKDTGISIAVGTVDTGVELAARVYYTMDICEALYPWFGKQSHYKIYFVRNCSTTYSQCVVEAALARHACTLSGLPVIEIVDPDERLKRFFLKDVGHPDFNLARCVIETVIIEKRCSLK